MQPITTPADTTQLVSSTDRPAPILDTRGPDPRPAAEPTAAGGVCVELVVDGGQAVEWLVGDIDVANCDHVVQIGTLALADPRVDALVIDLSQVTFFDSSGLGALVQLKNHSAAADKRLALRGVPPAVSKALALTSLDAVFGLTPGDAGRC